MSTYQHMFARDFSNSRANGRESRRSSGPPAERMPGGKGGRKKQVGRQFSAKRLNAAAASTSSAERSAKRIAAAVAAEVKTSSEEPRAMEVDAATTSAMKRDIASRAGGPRQTPAGAAVLYLGHIPHGFYEEQMKGFFSQFGIVTRLRLARNKKTGRSKHYAFIEFKHAEVAEVVAKAMNGYLLFSKILVAKVIAPEAVHSETFKDANRKWRAVDRVLIVRKEHNRARTEEEAARREAKLLRAESAKRRKLAAAGIEYEFGGYAQAAAEGGKRKRGVITTAAVPKPTTVAVLDASRDEASKPDAATAVPRAEDAASSQPARKKHKTAGSAAKAVAAEAATAAETKTPLAQSAAGVQVAPMRKAKGDSTAEAAPADPPPATSNAKAARKRKAEAVAEAAAAEAVATEATKAAATKAAATKAAATKASAAEKAADKSTAVSKSKAKVEVASEGDTAKPKKKRL